MSLARNQIKRTLWKPCRFRVCIEGLLDRVLSEDCTTAFDTLDSVLLTARELAQSSTSFSLYLNWPTATDEWRIGRMSLSWGTLANEDSFSHVSFAIYMCGAASTTGRLSFIYTVEPGILRSSSRIDQPHLTFLFLHVLQPPDLPGTPTIPFYLS